MTASRLTIVLPLKGRPLFTLRFLWHANRVGLKYRFLIADGQVHPALAALIENAAEHFPNLDLQYVRYPDDLCFTDYFAKMADVLSRVTTPYAMLADNDDFLAASGIERSLDFLEANADYVCCGGGLAGLSVYSRHRKFPAGLVGPLNKIAYRYMPFDRSRDFNSASMTERLQLGLRNSWSYYAVFRSPALLTIWREVAEFDLSDLQLHEKFCAMRTLTLGNARSDPATVGYWRQYWTTMGSAFSKDWVHHLLRNHFTRDLTAIVDRISRLAAEADGKDQDGVAEVLRGQIEPWLRNFLRLNYGMSGTVRGYLRGHVPWLLNWVKTRRRFSVPFERRRIVRQLRDHGASQDYLVAFAAELAQIEDVVTGHAFRDFLGPHVAKFAT